MKDLSGLTKISDSIDPFFPNSIVPQQNIPERMLLAAVLERAINDLIGTVHERRSARDWFEDNDSTFAFSFINICGLLNLDPDILRDGVFSLADEYRAKGKRILKFRKRTFYSHDFATMS